ncbi:MAG TPA: uracil-DNA glycosylase family protein [Bacteroidia bacterium]|nr:uracil-DNA glycosylase family protein [Bacteroidia bacterium]
MSTRQGIAQALDTLVGILEVSQKRGQKSTQLSADSLATLRDLPAQLRHRPTTPPEQVSTPESAPRTTAAAPTIAPVPDFVPSTPAPIILPAAPERDDAGRRAELNAIYKRLKQAPEPRALGSLFETIVFATGNPSAAVMLVGEAPGAEEEKQRKPFVGPAGQKLEQILKAMGLAREDVYISNVVKFRPKKGDGRFQGSSNRPPTQEEMATCLPFLRAEIETIQPRVIVALGRTAAEGLLERGGSIASFRQQPLDFSGTPVVVTYHPSYLLRQEAASPEEGKRAKRHIWEDMLRVMEIAGLPISEKQRGYFR